MHRMFKPRTMPLACFAGFAALAILSGLPQTGKPPAATPDTVEWFRATEQALMDALATGNKTVWETVMDSSCVVTSEEGQVISTRATEETE